MCEHRQTTKKVLRDILDVIEPARKFHGQHVCSSRPCFATSPLRKSLSSPLLVNVSFWPKAAARTDECPLLVKADIERQSEFAVMHNAAPQRGRVTSFARGAAGEATRFHYAGGWRGGLAVR